MSWKGALRSMQSAARKHERESRRRLRAQEVAARRDEVSYQKQLAREQAAEDVGAFEDRLEELTSIHRQCGASIDWAVVLKDPQPPPPERQDVRTAAARRARQDFQPGFFTKLFGRTEAALARLDAAIEKAQAEDALEFENAQAEHAKDVERWETETGLATEVLSGDPAGFEKAVAYMKPFEELKALGAAVNVYTSPSHPKAIGAEVRVAESRIVPEEAKTLTKTGALSVRAMPKSRGLDVYQDYVCGVVLRVARELVALLPVEAVVATATATMFNSATGHNEDVAILTVAAPRQLMKRLNFVKLDPSDAMANFPHRMSFKKTKGFEAIERMTWDDIPVIVDSK